MLLIKGVIMDRLWTHYGLIPKQGQKKSPAGMHTAPNMDTLYINIENGRPCLLVYNRISQRYTLLRNYPKQ